MKKYIFVFCAIITSFSLFGNPADRSGEIEELKDLFHQDFLEAADNTLLDVAIMQALTSKDSGLTPNELSEKLKQAVAKPEVEERFLSIYASIFNETELPEALKLIRNELYLKYRMKFGKAAFRCYLETKAILEEIVEKSEPFQSLQLISSILEVNQDNFEKVAQSSRPLIIDVYTDWCGPCKWLARNIQELNQEYGSIYQFGKLNAEEQLALAKSFGITSYPTVLFFKDGKEIERLTGYLSKEALLEKIHQLFPQS